MTFKIGAQDPMEELKKAFDIFVTKDRGESGEKRIKSADLEIISKEMCDGLDHHEIDAMITEFYPERDPLKEGISFEEFSELMSNLLPK